MKNSWSFLANKSKSGDRAALAVLHHHWNAATSGHLQDRIIENRMHEG